MTNFYLKISEEEEKTIWCKEVLDQMKQIQIELKNGIKETIKHVFIITDLRFQFEIEFFKQTLNNFDSNGKLVLIRIEASNTSREKRGWVLSNVDQTETETNLDNYSNWSLSFANNGTLEDLHSFVQSSFSFFV